MGTSFRRLLFLFLSTLSVALLGWTSGARAAALAATDAEIALRLDGITETGTANPATLDITGFGTRQVWPITPAVFDSFNRVRVSGVSNPAAPVVMMAAAFPNGDQLELDGQSGVRSDSLSLGQSAELLITLTGAIDIVNPNAFDTTMNIFYEREFFLTSGYTGTPAPAIEKSFSHGTFEILGQSFDAGGALADEFFRNFDQAVANGVSTNPEEKFNFDFVVPAGGTARFDMVATAYSRVALVPEPASISLFAWGCLPWFRRVRRVRADN